MNEDSRAEEAGTLAVSIVLHRPDRVQLAHTLDTLQAALGAAGVGWAERAVVFLTDHSPHPLPADERVRGGLAIDYAHDPGNPGFGAGHNAAFRRLAGADFFLVANPDLAFAPDSLAAGLAFLRAQPAVGLVAPALLEPDGGLRPACFRYPGLRVLGLRAAGAGRTHPSVAAYECRDWDAGATVFNPPLVSGCCMLFRSAAYAALGGFDPGYFLYFEDFDLSWRAGRLGLSAYHPAMRVAHAGGGAGRKGLRHQAYFFRSALRFYAMHGWRW